GERRSSRGRAHRRASLHRHAHHRLCDARGDRRKGHERLSSFLGATRAHRRARPRPRGVGAVSAHRTWGGRFQGTLADAMLRLSGSVAGDRALAEDDIRGSIAHARALERAKVLTADELARIVRGLETIGEEVRAGKMKWDPALEDVHMNIESRLIELVGPLG